MFQAARLLIPALILALLPCAAASDPVDLDAVLLVEPVSLYVPEGKLAKTDAVDDNLAALYGRGNLPANGAAVTLFGLETQWKLRRLPAQIGAGRTLCSVNLESARYSTGKLHLEWSGTATLFLDGGKLTPAEGKLDFTVTAPTGFHQLFLILDSKDPAATTLSMNWTPDIGTAPRFHTAASRTVAQDQLLDAPVVNSIVLSPDGSRVALTIRGYDRVAKKARTLTEIRATADGSLQQRWHDGGPGELVWSPDGRRMAYTIEDDLWVTDADGGTRKILAGAKGLSGLRWHPSGQSLLFHWETEAKPREDGMKRFQGMEDRWPGWRNRHQIFQFDLAGGWLRPLTAGTLSHDLLDISPDGTRLLAVRSPIDYSRPPYEKAVVLEIEIASTTAHILFESFAFRGAVYALDGIYVVAGPSAFDNRGNALRTGTVANDFDGQLYHFGTRGGSSVTPLSLSFDPSINTIRWCTDSTLVLTAIEKDRTALYHFGPGFKKIETPVDIVERFDVSLGLHPTMVFSGTSATSPQQVYLCDLDTGVVRSLYDPAPATYAQTRFGTVQTFSFQNSEGTEIDGRFYTPPDFDASRKYPLIVYYYGGTVPVDRQFTGRYPFNWWAANGYVIYVPQPSGAVGYGQTFSARHVNAWGERSADDIIESTRAFLAAHDFVSEDKIGIMGASYGGFMTMYLTTRTDMYAAAISHAGISSLTGYWGEGFWGYSYSGTASQGSFPWNNPDLYVKQSPVFSADKVTTPLLLLHGDSDTNVPPGQSHNMYTALKLLGKEVELITVAGQDHWILEHEKRLLWGSTILAWFDKQLKGEPEWWQALYPAP